MVLRSALFATPGGGLSVFFSCFLFCVYFCFLYKKIPDFESFFEKTVLNFSKN